MTTSLEKSPGLVHSIYKKRQLSSSIALGSLLCESGFMIQKYDSQLFIWLNSKLTHPFLDQWMPIITDLHKNQYFLIFAALPMLLFWMKSKKLQALPILFGLIACVGTVDAVTYRILKPTIKRERPPAVEETIQLRTDRYAGFGFPSNHAANNFAGAAFLSCFYPFQALFFYSYATLIAYSRVYVGVHYPGDVLAGALLGILFGLFFFRVFKVILPERTWK